ncbi:MAG: hypothetical protein K6D02_09225 [Lachnospiraceae bacterium]|nr:hypothetical protein [Lachnospiraceae bacterium]
MIYIFSALYKEAEAIIKAYNLKQNNDIKGVRSYVGEVCNDSLKSNICVVITGVGEINAAAAIGSVLALNKPKEGDILINYGCAGRSAGEDLEGKSKEEENLFIASKLIERSTEKSFYPDMRLINSIDNSLKEAVLYTEAKVYKKSLSKAGLTVLHDMEGAAIYQVGINYFSPEKMIFLKVISDEAEGEFISKEALGKLMEKAFKRVKALVDSLLKITGEKVSDNLSENLSENEEKSSDFLEKISFELKCSETMKIQLKQLICYAKNKGINYKKIIEEYRDNNSLPVKSKREGKVLLNELENKFIYENSSKRNVEKSFQKITPRTFSHIYVEKRVLEHDNTKRILEKFPGSKVIIIKHYKDIFCRKNQNIKMQCESPELILAGKYENLIYKGAPVCQSFGNEHFYYTSCVMNCIYNCEYCYLKGMYPSGHMVIFVNLEDTFLRVREILKEHDAYICISYDTDLMAVEGITGFVKKWVEFVEEVNYTEDLHNLKLEIRTKCGRTDLWEGFKADKNIIFAFTLSPQKIIDLYEKKAASMDERIKSAALALKKGFNVRLCIDPIIYDSDWKKIYGELINSIEENIEVDRLYDVSVGSFRISQDYLKNIRRVLPDSDITWFPYENEDKVYHYPRNIMNEMEEYVENGLIKIGLNNKIYKWKE